MTRAFPSVSSQRLNVLLWLLVVGSTAALGRPPRSRFVAQLVNTCLALSVLTVSVMKAFLMRIVWVESSDNMYLVSTLWIKVW